MDPNNVKRRLTCILAADAVGYSKQMEQDEEGTIRVLLAHRAVIDGILAFHQGRIVSTAGDSVLAEFSSVVEAVRCAVEVQEALKTRNESLPDHRKMHFRVGVNLGDVVVKDDDLLGDGVNVAARLETMAEPGGICISSSVYDQITGKLDLGFHDIGEQALKNISRPIRVYRLSGAVPALRLAPSAPSAPSAPPAPNASASYHSRRYLPWVAGGTALALGVGGLALWQGRLSNTTPQPTQATANTSPLSAPPAATSAAQPTAGVAGVAGVASVATGAQPASAPKPARSTQQVAQNDLPVTARPKSASVPSAGLAPKAFTSSDMTAAQWQKLIGTSSDGARVLRFLELHPGKFAELRAAAEKGNAEAQGNLARMYNNGWGAPKDKDLTFYWAKKAADQGNALGQNYIGQAFFQGDVVAKDLKQAARWYRLAAEQGFPVAQSNLGWMYMKGNGVTADASQAVNWFRKAAEQGSSNGQSGLGFAYERGRGVARDDTEALKWYQLAAEQGYADGQSGLGFMNMEGRGTNKNDAEALKWIRRAVDQGNASGQNLLGLAYERGQGVEKSEVDAVKWYRLAAQQGYAIAQSNLGWMYFNGKTTRNDSEAVRWFRAAAEQGDANGQNGLGVAYERGQGVAKDLVQAANWYRKAADNGNSQAKANLDRLK